MPWGIACDTALTVSTEGCREDRPRGAGRRHVTGPVVVVWDRLAAHRSWLTVEYLPAYAPELNPLEYLWSTLKGKDVANYPADSIEQLDGHLRRSVRRVRRRRDMGLSFIKHATLISDNEYLQL